MRIESRNQFQRGMKVITSSPERGQQFRDRVTLRDCSAGQFLADGVLADDGKRFSDVSSPRYGSRDRSAKGELS
jgi:hypothetical protein